jgi:hypothetical protein
MSKKTVNILNIVLLFVSGTLTLSLQAQALPTSCRVYCPDGSSYLIDCNSNTDPCPTNKAKSGTSAGTSTSNSDFQLQLIQSAVPIIMELFKTDPKKQQAQLEAQQRELEKIAIENENQRQIKEALAQTMHDKLMELYKPLPDALNVETKSLTESNTNLEFKSFDGDNSGYMYKDVDVANSKDNPDSENKIAPIFGSNLSPRNIQTLLEPDNDPMIVDLRNANNFIEKNIKSDGLKTIDLKKNNPKGNGNPIPPKCEEVERSLKIQQENRMQYQKQIQFAQSELNEWEKKNNQALWNAAESGASFLFKKYLQQIEASKKNAGNIKQWLLDFEKPLKNKGVPVDNYLKLLDTKILNFNLAKWGIAIDETLKAAFAVRDETQAIAEHIAQSETHVAAILNDPTIKAFLNEGDSKIEATTFGITEASAKNLNNAYQVIKVVGNYLTIVNPIASLAQFAIDETYNASDWTLSYQVILQERKVKGDAMRESEILQQKIDGSFEMMKNCK